MRSWFEDLDWFEDLVDFVLGYFLWLIFNFGFGFTDLSNLIWFLFMKRMVWCVVSTNCVVLWNSPSGKLVQIEHALTAVGSGQTSLGIKGNWLINSASGLDLFMTLSFQCFCWLIFSIWIKYILLCWVVLLHFLLFLIT